MSSNYEHSAEFSLGIKAMGIGLHIKLGSECMSRRRSWRPINRSRNQSIEQICIAPPIWTAVL